MTRVRMLGSETDLTEDEVTALYAYPDGLDRTWVRAGFVASVDGAVSVDGRTAGLSTPGDAVVFRVLRELADVVLVGAGTARAENYGGVSLAPEISTARSARGQADVPPVAVVTSTGNLDPTSRLFTATAVAPIVLGCEGVDRARLAVLRDAGADVVVLPGRRVSAGDAMAELARRGLVRVLCEGGPGLLGDLVAAGLVDELCLTTAPLLAGGSAGRIATGPAEATALPLTPAHVMTDSAGALLARWVRV